jgi:hypothetical protein
MMTRTQITEICDNNSTDQDREHDACILEMIKHKVACLNNIMTMADKIGYTEIHRSCIDMYIHDIHRLIRLTPLGM